MDNPRELILCGVRCFQGAQRGLLRPITLLVGENSTGKTTFLGCYGILHQVFSRPDVDRFLDFNEQPFAMGGFRDIVRTKRGAGGRIDEFKIGLAVDPASDSAMPPYTLFVTFREQGSQPVISSFRFQFEGDSFLELRRSADGTIWRIPGHDDETQVPFHLVVYMLDLLRGLPADDKQDPAELPGLQPVARYVRGLTTRREGADHEPNGAVQVRAGFAPPRLPELIPVAPLRSRPERSYNPIRETASPEGEHVPMLMMRLNRTDQDHWKSLHDDLAAFGRRSGLFSDIKVKRHGRQMSDPFQLQVKVRTGPHANIVDVGYGVSQALPIVVDVMAAGGSHRGAGRDRRTGGRSFLLQQPEIHLHPRGQAELANLFIDAFKRDGSRFLIETHSDYIVDRVRISVRKKVLRPGDVSILYFEPRGDAVTIHNMDLDEHGNLQGAPAGYRDFFLRETDELLGFAD